MLQNLGDTPRHAKSVMGIGWEKRREAYFYLRKPDSEDERLQNTFETLNFDITSGAMDGVEKNGALLEGVYLARAHLQNMLVLRCCLEYYDTIARSGFEVTELDGTPIVDRKRQLRIGASLFVRNWNSDGGRVQSIVHGASTLVMSIATHELMQKGELSFDKELFPFVTAAGKVKGDPELQKSVFSILEAFERGRFLPEEGVLREIIFGPIPQASVAISKMEDGWNHPNSQLRSDF